MSSGEDKVDVALALVGKTDITPVVTQKETLLQMLLSSTQKRRSYEQGTGIGFKSQGFLEEIMTIILHIGKLRLRKIEWNPVHTAGK